MKKDKKYGWAPSQSRFATGEREVGPHTRKRILFLPMVILFLTLVHPPAAAADVVSFSVSMLEGEQQTRFNNPVFVTGVWQYVNITMDQSVDDLTLRFMKDLTLPTDPKNETNYYEWAYQKQAAIVWSDASGYGSMYIKDDLCSNMNAQYRFCVGTNDAMPNIVGYYENWTVEIETNGALVHSQPIVLEKPKTGVSLSKPSSIIFYVDPFTVMDAQGDNFFKIGNIGNLPLNVTIDYEKYRDIEITDLNRVFLPAEVITHYAIVHSRSWPPGIKRMNVQLTGSYPQSYFVDSNATVTLYTSFIIDVPELIIYVGHSNYRIDEIQGTHITFQFIEQLTMYEGEVRDINAYVSGNGAVTLEIWADEQNISVLKLTSDNTQTQSPIAFTSTNTSERTIVATVEALSEGKTGILSYRLTSDGVTKLYTTRITIGPPESPDTEQSSNPGLIMQIIVIIAVLLVVLYMLVSYMKKRKR
jgi:hypothetical protein